MVAPAGWSVKVSPGQMLSEMTVTFGLGRIVKETKAVSAQKLLLPITVALANDKKLTPGVAIVEKLCGALTLNIPSVLKE